MALSSETVAKLRAQSDAFTLLGGTGAQGVYKATIEGHDYWAIHKAVEIPINTTYSLSGPNAWVRTGGNGVAYLKEGVWETGSDFSGEITDKFGGEPYDPMNPNKIPPAYKDKVFDYDPFSVGNMWASTGVGKVAGSNLDIATVVAIGAGGALAIGAAGAAAGAAAIPATAVPAAAPVIPAATGPSFWASAAGYAGTATKVIGAASTVAGLASKFMGGSNTPPIVGTTNSNTPAIFNERDYMDAQSADIKSNVVPLGGTGSPQIDGDKNMQTILLIAAAAIVLIYVVSQQKG